MKNQKRLGNKGFSLVELIVVIAIMAVLVAVIAPTLINKIEVAREGTDLQALGEVRSAVVDALANEKVYKGVVNKEGTTTFTINADDMTVNNVTNAEAKTKLETELKTIIEKVEWKSNACDGQDITVKVSSTGKVYAYIEGETAGSVLETDDTKFEAGTPIKDTESGE